MRQYVVYIITPLIILCASFQNVLFCVYRCSNVDVIGVNDDDDDAVIIIFSSSLWTMRGAVFRLRTVWMYDTVLGEVLRPVIPTQWKKIGGRPSSTISRLHLIETQISEGLYTS